MNVYSELPANPDIDQLRRQAKDLLREARSGDAEAVERLNAAGALHQRAILADAQREIAKGYGFASWPKLHAAVVSRQTSPAGLQAVQPVFADKAGNSDALFTASGFVTGARQAGWDPGPLPDAIIFTFHAVYAKLLEVDDRFERNELLAPGNSTMFMTKEDGPRVGVTCLSPGATAMVGQVENQVALGGASQFAIVGTAGTINPDTEIGSIVVVDSAVRDDGISQHYLPPDTYVDSDPVLARRLLGELQERGLPADSGVAWTVPTPYRSTAAEVEQLVAEGVSVVECEVASLLAVAEALGVSAGACLSVTSSLVSQTEDSFRLRPPSPQAVLDAVLDVFGVQGHADV